MAKTANFGPHIDFHPVDDSFIKIRNDHGQSEAMQYGQRLYHYTSLRSFFGIIKNKELWFGNTVSMNDKMELREFTDSLRAAVSEDCPEKKEEVNHIWAQIDRKSAERFPYAMCFSSRPDDAAQWERYADMASGVCIVMDTDKLTQLFHSHLGYLNKVSYDNDIRKHKHYEIITSYLSEGKWGEFRNEDAWTDNVVATAANYKHLSFSSESEIRLIILSELVGLDEAKGFFRTEFEFTDHQIKKVLKVNLDKLCRFEGIPIESVFDGVIVAPRSNQPIDVLSEFLRANGFHKLAENVQLSQCPLR